MKKWAKLPIGELFSIEKGSLQSTKCIPGEYTFITASSEWKTHNEYSHDCEALIYAVAASGSLGRCHYYKGKFIASDLCFVLRAKDEKKIPINYRFYQNVFKFLREDIVAKTKAGTSKESISQKRFSNYLLPYINIEHQLYWESKLINFNKNIENLNNESHTQSTLLTKLRQAILQEAIEGKLSAEWRKENPVRKGDPNYDAEALLEKIKAEKEKLLKEGKIKKQKALPTIKPEEMLFKLPDGWVWTRLGELGFVNPRNYIDDNLDTGFSPMPFISNEYGRKPLFEIKKWYLIKSGFTHFANNDVAIAKITPCFENSKACVFDGLPNGYGAGTTELHVLRPIEVNSKYIYINLKTSKFLNEGEKLMTGAVGQKRVPVSYFENYHIPLPPLAEQQAIVERVDKLLAIVDELEKQVADRKEKAEQLMQAVLREAFEGEYKDD